MSGAADFDAWWSLTSPSLHEHLVKTWKEKAPETVTDEVAQNAISLAMRDFEAIAKLGYEAGGNANMKWLTEDMSVDVDAVVQKIVHARGFGITRRSSAKETSN